MNLEKYTASTIIPSRSKYQLRHFVIGQHDTPAMRWRQVLLEGQDMAYKIRSAELSLQKSRIKLDQLLASDDPIDAIDAEQQQLDLTLLERTLAGARLELQWLTEIAEEVGVHTFDEIEADQAEYWHRRLQRQADADILAARQGISAGNIAAMLQAGLIEWSNGAPSALTPGDTDGS
jgi:hypothetical protein